MYSYGGVYVDLDFRALRRFDTLLENKCVVLGMMENNFRLDDAIPNAIMASVPGHPFWLLCVRKVIDRHFLGFRGTETNFSGSFVLKEAYQDWCRIHNNTEFKDASNRSKSLDTGGESSHLDELFPCQEVRLEPKGVLYPYSWVWEPQEIKKVCDFSKESSNPDEELCLAKILKKYPDAYSITFWTHSWSAKGSLCEKRPSLCKP
ncbi:Inositol phosphoceramide mannosyltransferase 3 [Galdieria sulphuraria]|nr:Inositol phosphoceramide mannosyltransferase 3 [Galdieria sulphuraria]